MHTPGETQQHRYQGEANFEVLDSGVLHVWPRDERRPKQVVYGPAGWLWVEVHSGPSVAATPQIGYGSEDDDGLGGF